jgi:hypothetical protein
MVAFGGRICPLDVPGWSPGFFYLYFDMWSKYFIYSSTCRFTAAKLYHFNISYATSPSEKRSSNSLQAL